MLGGLSQGNVSDCEPDLGAKIMEAIHPVIEQEVARRVQEYTASLVEELRQARERYLLLERKHEALQQAMQQSREAFEKKKSEWQTLKETLSQKQRLKLLLDSLESCTPIVSPVDTVDSSVETTQMPGDGSPLVNATQSEDPLSTGQGSAPRDVLLDLAALVDDNSGSSLHDVLFDQQARSPGVLQTAPIAADRERGSPKYAEALRTKFARKQAHARDCPCCTRFYQIADMDTGIDRGQHIHDVSRHRYREEVQNTPPGFWDVNFTPRQ